MFFLLLCYYLPLKKSGAKLESLLPKDDFCQIWLKLAQWFWRRCLKFVNVFSLFRNYLPLKKGGALQLYKLKFPSHKNALCQVWLKLANWFFRRRFLNFVHLFSVLRNNLPLEKGLSIYFQNWNFLHPGQRCFVPSLVEIDLMILEIF